MFPNIRQKVQEEPITLELMELSIEKSVMAWTARVDGRPVATYGIVDRDATEPAFVWLFSTEGVPPVMMMREARKFIRWATARFGALATLGGNWVERLGFRPDGEGRWVKWL